MNTTAAVPAWATLWTERALADLPADLTTATPAQVDEVIRTVSEEMATATAEIDRAYDALHKGMGHNHVSERTRTERGYAYSWHWTADGERIAAHEALSAAREWDPTTPAEHYYDGRTIGALVAAIDAAYVVRAEMYAVVTRMNDEYRRRGGWTRFYLVDNSTGHVHTTTSCRNTFPTTAWQWPTQLSGGDAHTVVEAAGERTCLTCFPEVRAEILAGRPIRLEMFDTPEGAAARAQRDAEKNAKQAEKIAKGVTPDGKPLVIELVTGHARYDKETVSLKTLRAAELRYVEWAAQADWATDRARNANLHERTPEHVAQRRAAETAKRDGYALAAGQVLAAIAAKKGITVEAARKAYAAKVQTRYNRGY